MTIEIKTLENHDQKAWGPLWQGYLKYYKSELPDNVTATTWTRLMDPDFGLHALGAFEDQRLVGIVHYLFHPVTWSKTDRCYLEDLFTEPATRGKGVGRALIEAVTEEAKAAGADQVYWMTEDFNKRAQTLYDKVASKTPFIKYARFL